MRGECRSNQRTGAGDGGEVVTKHNPLVRRHIVASIVQSLGGGRARRVELEDVVRDDPAVEPVGDEVAADRRGKKPRGTDFLAVCQRDGGNGASTEQCDGEPRKESEQAGGHGGQESGQEVTEVGFSLLNAALSIAVEFGPTRGSENAASPKGLRRRSLPHGHFCDTHTR